jgi:hypothetical protein
MFRWTNKRFRLPRTRASLIFTMATIALWVFLISSFWQCGAPTWVAGHVDPNSSAGQLVLRGVAAQGRPLIDALEHYHQKHGAYPDKLKELGKTDYGWSYYSYDAQGYSISTNLGKEPMLNFKRTSKDSVWEFDPGDGGGTTVLPFN